MRKAQGLSQEALAKAAGVSKMSISKYEHGQMAPSSPVLLRIAEATNTPVEFFFRPTHVSLERPQFRRRASMPKYLEKRIEADILDQVERFLETLALYPEPPLTPFTVPEGLPERVNTLNDVEQLADSLRDQWKLGRNAIRFLAEILEEKGLLVLTTSVTSESKFDGLAATVNDWPLIVVGGRDEWPGDRQRFTMAHELGHLVLADRLADDLDEEKACNRFAGAFLVPQDMVRRELGTSRQNLEWRELHALKHAYGLSMAAWVYRAADLGVISDQRKNALFKQRSANGWHRQEPGKPIRPERPHLFERLVLHAHAEGLASTTKAAELLRISTSSFRTRLLFENGDATPGH